MATIGSRSARVATARASTGESGIARNLPVLAFLLGTLIGTLADAATAEETPKALVTLHLKESSKAAQQLWVLSYNETGLRVRKLADTRVRRIGWDQIEDRDRTRLRLQFRLDISDQEMKGLVDGVRLHLKGGNSVDGVLEKVAADGAHWLRRGGTTLPYPKDRIIEVEPMLLDEARVYGADALYHRLMERMRPKTAKAHVQIADRMMDAADFTRGAHHYKEAIRLEPDQRWRLKPKLSACESMGRDAALAKALRRSHSLSHLQHRYDDARAVLEEQLSGRGGSSRLVLKALDRLDSHEADRLNRQFHERKNVELRRCIEDYLRQKKPSLGMAKSYIDSELESELLAKLRTQLDLTDDQVRQFRARGSSGSAHWATFHHGSFIFDPFAKRGRASKSDRRGNPDAWWTQHRDVSTRSAFLRAYAAERLSELFETVRIKYKPCAGCGGKGAQKGSSIRGLRGLGGRHEWFEICDRCYGCGRDRVVAYR